MKLPVCSAFILFCSASLMAQQSPAPAPVPVSVPVPVEDEPHHHLVLKNAFIEVMAVNIPPGETSLFHTHAHDGAAISLATSMTTQQKPGEAEGPAGTFKLGGLSVRTLTDGPFTHRVHNVGTVPFEVLDVEFLERPKEASDAAAPVAAENASGRLYNWTLAPGATSALHTHKRPYLIVSVTPMTLAMTAPDGKSMAHGVKAGEFYWVDAAVTHSLTNAGSAEGQIVEIELK